jgi:putative ABC transport system permease protein
MIKALFTPWIWRLAWRDGRASAAKIALAVVCIVIAVAAVVAGLSFRSALQRSTFEQSKTLLGADLALSSREPFSEEAERLIASLGGDQSRQIAFTSMAYFPKNGASRLVQVRVMTGAFPYYGALETDPPFTRSGFESGANALVDETVMLQFNLNVGDAVKIGDQEFRIAAKLRKIPGESLAFSLVSPRVYLPLNHFNQPDLLQRGSLVRYRVFFKFDDRVDVNALVDQLAPQLEQLRLEADTVRMRMRGISNATANLSRYLSLAVFVAVLLAGVGVASGVHVYAKEKNAAVAMLRCVGATARQSMAVFMIQSLVAAVLGSVLGAALGIALQTLLPLAFKDFIPLRGSTLVISPYIIGFGIFLGLTTTSLFALWPLLGLRQVSPALALRSSIEKSRKLRDPLLWLLCAAIVALIFAFAYLSTRRWSHAVWFTAGVLLSFGTLTALAWSLSAAIRKLVPYHWPFSWRQGLANLHRPDNQTVAVMLSIGLGTFLLATLYNARAMLLRQVEERGATGEANLVLFDVQSDQRADVGALLQSLGIPNPEQVPIITTRLAAVKGRSVDEIRRDEKPSIPLWALRREYRSTYRDHLTGTEQIIAGRWQGRVAAETRPIPISIEKGIAEALRVGVGDTLQFDLQGVPLDTVIASIREVDWQRIQPNFFVVFPAGVLEQAPQFYAVVTRADSKELSARIQRAVVERFPNVSMIDLALVLDTLESILNRVTSAIRFIALFTILTGIAVLTSAILSRRSQRLKESILLKTLGAPRRQIVATIVAEYLCLSLIACLAGAILSIFATWGLSYFFFGTVPAVAPISMAAIGLSASALTVALGVAGCWGIFKKPALEALRAET